MLRHSPRPSSGYGFFSTTEVCRFIAALCCPDMPLACPVEFSRFLLAQVGRHQKMPLAWPLELHAFTGGTINADDIRSARMSATTKHETPPGKPVSIHLPERDSPAAGTLRRNPEPSKHKGRYGKLISYNNVAHRLAIACFHILRRKTDYDMRMQFGK